MDIKIGDVLEMKKAHPCGGNRMLVMRVGADFRLKCEKCGHEARMLVLGNTATCSECGGRMVRI